VVRDDLGTTLPEVTYFMHSSSNEHEEGRMSIHDMTELVVPRYGSEYEFKFDFESVEDNADWYGVKCQKYINGRGATDIVDYLYVKDGFPIGLQKNNKEFNFTFSEGAVLNEFVFDRSIQFAEQRVYSPPNTTYCSSLSSSSSSQTTSSSSQEVSSTQETSSSKKKDPSKVSLSVSSMVKPMISLVTILLVLFHL